MVNKYTIRGTINKNALTLLFMNHPFSSFINDFISFLLKTYSLDNSVTSSIIFDYNLEQKRKDFGDLSCNAPLVLGKILKKSPFLLAQELSSLFFHPDCIAVQAHPAGFLNFLFTNNFYTDYLSFLLSDTHALSSSVVTDSKILSYNIEFVSANPTGPLHIGHGRGAVIGDVLVRLLRARGHTVCAEFYINDAGSQIDKLGLSFKARCQQVCGHDAVLPEGGYQGEYLLEMARDLIDKESSAILEKPDAFFAQYAKEMLLEQLKQTLKHYGVEYDVWFSEKSLHDSGDIDTSVSYIVNNGNTKTEEDALWLVSTRYRDDKDRVLKRSDGLWTYAAADLAYLKNKLDRGFEHLIMILGQDHHSYLIRLKAMLQSLGYSEDTLDVLLYQLVTLKEGDAILRLSKRKGKIISLFDVIEAVGADVARFFYLYRKMDAHLDFDIDLALENNQKNPVYYIQYAYVRVKSILKKATDCNFSATVNSEYSYDFLERMIIRKVMHISLLCSLIEKNHQTHLIAYYTHELASLFHAFYEHAIVIDKENTFNTTNRLSLLYGFERAFDFCFNIMGISKPEVM